MSKIYSSQYYNVLKIRASILLVFGLSFSVFAQFDTTGGRYIKPIFDSVVVIQDVVYATGVNSTGVTQDLVMDIYQPSGDNFTARPFIILAHGGSFIQGNKADLAFYCEQFAKKGYVTASIQYRLGFSSLSAAGLVTAVICASQDFKNAIRFLRKSTSEGNPYGLNPDFAFAGGFSAGGITALHLGYLDELSEVPIGQNIPTLDSLHNSGQIPGVDWKVKAILNIAGCVGDTNWIKPGDLPVISFAGTADGTVPFVSGSFGIPFGGSVPAYGSQSIYNRTQNIGVRSELRAFVGAGHDYSVNFPWAIDTTESRITRFLLPFLLEPTTSNELVNKTLKPFIYSDGSSWFFNPNHKEGKLELYSLQGVRLREWTLDGSSICPIPEVGFARIIRWSVGDQQPIFAKILPVW